MILTAAAVISSIIAVVIIACYRANSISINVENINIKDINEDDTSLNKK